MSAWALFNEKKEEDSDLIVYSIRAARNMKCQVGLFCPAKAIFIVERWVLQGRLPPLPCI